MADFTPEQIAAAAEAFKAVGSIDPTFAKILGGILTLGGVISASLTFINNIRTKRNTEVTKANTSQSAYTMDALSNHAKKIEESEARMKTLMSDHEKKMERLQQEGVTWVNQLKIVTVKVKNETESKLSRIPKVEDAIEALQKRADRIEQMTKEHGDSIAPLVAGIKKRFGDKP